MPEPVPQPTPEPVKPSSFDWSKLSGPVLIVAGILFVSWRGIPLVPPGPAPLPPAPVVIVEPTKFGPADTVVELNGVRLDSEKTKLFCDVVNSGDGSFQVTYQPVGKAKEVRRVVVSGGVVPPGPEPPGPGPKPPVPPNPDEPPPIPGTGLRVLFVHENNPSSPEAVLSKEQHAALFSKNVSDYLDSKCPKGPDGKTPEWRRYDQHQKMDRENAIWVDAMKRPHNVIPWVLISNGINGFEGPLPETEAELLALIKKFGGA
jgi:hypothetical protein